MKPDKIVHNRRSFIKASTGLAAGLGLLPTVNLFGFDLINRCWVADKQPSSTIVPIPLLDGELVSDPASLAAAANDFGHLIHRTPKAVLKAGSVNDIVKVIRYAPQK